MNSLLDVKLRFEHEPNNQGGGARNLRVNNKVTVSHLFFLIDNLNKVKKFYLSEDRFINNALVDVFYNDIIAKSNRIKYLFSNSGDSNSSIVGARFYKDGITNLDNHVITHYIDIRTIDNAIKNIGECIKFLNKELNGEANSTNFDSSCVINYSGYSISKTKIRDIIIDCSVIVKIDCPRIGLSSFKDQSIITFYKTEKTITDLFNSLNIDENKYIFSHVGENTISASRDTVLFLVEKIPYLISMISTDISKIKLSDIARSNPFSDSIPNPTNEPTIGVIDTLFDTSCYFSKWVDYRETLTDVEKYLKKEEHLDHGTAVSSIIVDGPSLNPWLNDGCGRFRVRHFGVCPGKISPTLLMNKIKRIITENPDIHVWNLSLGTDEEVSKNFISFDAAVLDDIQKEKNLVFVVSGTNDERNPKEGVLRIGSPADSLNSLVVNSVKRDGSPASYARNGEVLSFFNKPDVSYYGGDYEEDERIVVITSKGKDKQYGTSLAAPWISRKLCYLIDVLGFPREVAKALIIDSAAGWEYKQNNYKYKNMIGYGVVPIKIEDIVQSDNSEIKFTLFGTANTYKTANYAIPVPKDGDNSYYIARATLCYFPECDRLQGVDYTQRELSMSFGILKDTIIDINYNTQDNDGSANDERKSRKEFRKWENTKFISSLLRNKYIKPHKLYNDGFWAISLVSKERASVAAMNNMNFGVVVTLKNLNGENRINEFRHACLLRGYIVSEITVENRVKVYNSAQEDIKFD